MHFIHVRSPHENAFPLVVTHGWPGSIFEFHKILGPLTDPTKHGGDARDAFHVVCPSIPGYGFSEAPKHARLGRAPDGRDEREADGAARLREVRRAGRRLGRDHLGAERARRQAALRRHPPQHGRRVPGRGHGSRRDGGSRRPTRSRASAISATSRRTRPATSRSRAPSRRRSATGSTIRRPDSRRGSSRSSAPGATAVATSRSASPRTSCSPT